MKKRTTIAILTAVALATGAMGFASQASAWGRGAGDRSGHADHFGDNLSLSATQKLQMKEINDKWGTENEKLQRETAWELRDYRYDLSAGRKIDADKVSALKSRMVSLEVARIKLHRQEYNLLDDSQKKLAEAMFKDGPRMGSRAGRGYHRGEHNISGKNNYSHNQDPKFAQDRDKMREENRSKMQAMRDEMHTAVTGNLSDSELEALAVKRVDQRFEMMSQRGKARYEMRQNCSPQGGRNFRKSRHNS